MDSRLYPQGKGGVKARYSGGDLIFYDSSGNEIYRIEPAQRAFSPPEVANVNTSPGVPVVHRITASSLTGDVDVVLKHKTRVLDAWCVATAAGGASDTITVKNGGTAITDAMDLNVADKVVVRAGTIDDAQHEIAAGGTLRVTGASAATCEVYVLGIRVA